MPRMVSTACSATCPQFLAMAEVFWDNSRALRAFSVFVLTVDEISSIVAAVSSREAAWASVRREMSPKLLTSLSVETFICAEEDLVTRRASASFSNALSTTSATD